MRRAPNPRERGVTFVVVLAILAALVALVGAFAATGRAAVREETGRIESLRARLAAEAGVQRAMAELATLSTDRTLPTAPTDAWATLGQNGAEEFTLASGAFRVQILDASGRLNLNTATAAELTNLGLTQEQNDSLLDWREAGGTPRTEGAKDAYYNGLPEPYNARLGRLRTAGELLLVKGFSPDVLYRPGALTENTTTARPTVPGAETVALADLVTPLAYSPNDAPTGDARFNLNGNATAVNATTIAARLRVAPAVANAIVAAKTGRPNGQFTLLSQVLTAAPTAAASIVDNATVVPSERLEGRINFNTAPVEVLAALPNVTPDVAQSIADRAASAPFARLSEILALNNSPGFAATVADNAAVRSSVFLVRSLGRAGSTTVALVATVRIGNDTVGGTAADDAPHLLRVEDAPYADMASRWNWDDATTTTSLQEAPRS